MKENIKQRHYLKNAKVKKEYSDYMGKKVITFVQYTGELNGRVYSGTARVHPQDMDLCSTFTGERIATLRAYISLYKDICNELRIRIKEAKTIYNIKGNKVFKKELLEHINELENELRECTIILKYTKHELMNSIVEKDKQFKKIRFRREHPELRKELEQQLKEQIDNIEKLKDIVINKGSRK